MFILVTGHMNECFFSQEKINFILYKRQGFDDKQNEKEISFIQTSQILIRIKLTKLHGI